MSKHHRPHKYCFLCDLAAAAAGGAKLAALREAVEADPVLHELAETPLMLSIMSLAYQGVDGNGLTGQKVVSLEERRKRIFGLYVEQMFHRRGTASLVFPKEKIIGWLSWLAGKMSEHSQSVFLVEGLQPSWLGTRAKRIAYKVITVLIFWLIFWPIIGLIGGLFFGLIGSFVLTPVNKIHLVETVSWNWHESWAALSLTL